MLANTCPGWKQNPIAFDSLFNQSSHTFSFGSPDILPMFARGAVPGRVDMESYGEEEEDFTADAANLDIWVLDHFRDLLKRAETNATLDAQLRAPGTVIFLHLLGLDTTGHTYRPKSVEYIGNLMVVDAIVKEVERMLAVFYGEEKEDTAFIFSADHGMSNKGNHGDGEPDNTRTPLVAWGAGVRGPKACGDMQKWREEEAIEDSYYSRWGGLDALWREDVKQADVTPLMAALLGVNMPANSEGVLPLDYLDMSHSQAALASLANALEVLEMFRVKHEQRSKQMIRYVPFSRLPPEGSEAPGTSAVQVIKAQIKGGSFEAALQSCAELIDLSLQGAHYLQTYDWLLLVGVVLTGYLGSIVYGLVFLLTRYVLSLEQLSKITERPELVSRGNIVAGSVLVILFAKYAAEKTPATYFLYAAFAAWYWSRIIDEGQVFVIAWQGAMAGRKNGPITASQLSSSIALRVLLSMVALEVMVYGYLHRIAWTAGFVIIGFLWPAVGISAEVKTRYDLLLLAWTIACGVCATLTLSTLDKEESVPFLVASGMLFFIAGSVIVAFPPYFLKSDTGKGRKDAKDVHLERTLSVLKLQLVVLALSTIVTASSSSNLQQKKGLPLVNQTLAWLVLVVCLTVPFLYGFRGSSTGQGNASSRQPASHRLTLVIFAFAPVFVLLSIRDETLFFGCYSVTLLLWGKLEGSLYEERRYAAAIRRSGVEERAIGGRALEKEDVRIAIYFLFFLHVGFFGTGNIASISSFYLSPVYRLVPVFSPFLMAALLLLKILTPFVILASTFQLVCLNPPHQRASSGLLRRTGIDLAGPPLFGQDSVGGLGLKDAYSLVLLACISTDVLAVSFLVTVQTTGSWLEIGQSITHFAMANLLQVFMLALSAVADAVVGGGAA